MNLHTAATTNHAFFAALAVGTTLTTAGYSSETTYVWLGIAPDGSYRVIENGENGDARNFDPEYFIGACFNVEAPEVRYTVTNAEGTLDIPFYTLAMAAAELISFRSKFGPTSAFIKDKDGCVVPRSEIMVAINYALTVPSN